MVGTPEIAAVLPGVGKIIEVKMSFQICLSFSSYKFLLVRKLQDELVRSTPLLRY